jgi:hypothetical protein
MENPEMNMNLNSRGTTLFILFSFKDLQRHKGSEVDQH